MRKALKTPGFRSLVLVWTVINIADSVLFLTLAIWVKDLTQSDSAAGLSLAALGAPALLAPFTGHLADRVSRKKLVSVAALIAAASVLVLTRTDELWLIYVVTLVYATIGYLLAAAQSGLLRDLLPDELLSGANGLLTTIDQGLRLVMPFVGAGLYVSIGMGAVATTTAVLFVIAAIGMTAVKVTETPPAPKEPRAVTAGFRHLFGTPLLGGMTVALAVAVGATGITNTTTFAVIEQGLGKGPELLAAIASVQGAGAVVGGLTAGLLIARIGEQVAASVGVTLLGLGIATTVGSNLWLICVGIFAAGLGVSWTVVAFVTLRQRLTPANLQGRASAASNMALNVPQMTTALIAAALIAVVDYRIMTGFTVVVILGTAASIAVSRERKEVPA